MRLFSEGRGKGKWREYVVADDAAKTKLNGLVLPHGQ